MNNRFGRVPFGTDFSLRSTPRLVFVRMRVCQNKQSPA